MALFYVYASWIPLLWLVLAIALGIAEAATADLIAIWFSVGALAAIVPSMMKAPFWAQLLVFLVVSLITLAFTRPMAKEVLKVRMTHTNADGIIGMMGVVIVPVDNVTGVGRIYVNGLDWSARSDDGSPLDKDEKVLVKSIEGVKAIVERVV